MPPDAKILISPPHCEIPTDVDESACCPGCSSCAKLGDLAAGSSCRERMAPRYREAFVTMSSRRSISVSELQHKDFCRCDALVWEGGCASCIARACKRMVSTGRGVREGGYEMILGSKSSLESGSHLTLLTSSATTFCFRTVPGSSNYAHRGDLAPSRTRSDATDLKETASGANSLRRVLDHKHAVARLARKPCDGSAPPTHSSL